MTCKVFIFDNGGNLLVDDLEFDTHKKVFKGHVVNGNWSMMYDPVKGELNDSRKSYQAKLLWAGDAKGCFDYNYSINDAMQRYMDGEPSNFSITQYISEEDFEEDIPY